MKVFKTADGLLRIKIEDSDAYMVEKDGVNFWPTDKQVRQIIRNGGAP